MNPSGAFAYPRLRGIAGRLRTSSALVPALIAVTALTAYGAAAQGLVEPSAQYWGTLIAVFAGSFVAGFAGFAFSAVAGALLFHFMDPVSAVPLMLACSITTQLLGIAKLRGEIRPLETGLLLLVGLPGIPLGAALLRSVDASAFAAGFGLFLLLYATYMLVQPQAEWRVRSRSADVVVGFFGGIVGGAIAFPGALPAIWCILRRVQKAEQRAIVQPFILVMQIATLLYFSGVGLLTPALAAWYASCVPAVIAGTLLGFALFNRIDERTFRTAVLSLLVVCAIPLLS